MGDRVKLVSYGGYDMKVSDEHMFVNNWKLGSVGTVIEIHLGEAFVKIDKNALIVPPSFLGDLENQNPRTFLCKESMIEKVEEKLWYLTDPGVLDKMDYRYTDTFWASITEKTVYPTFTPITKKSTMNSLVSKVADLFITEPQKTFRKLGITDDRNNLTEQGEMVFINWLFTQNQDAFNTAIATPLLAEQNSKK